MPCVKASSPSTSAPGFPPGAQPAGADGGVAGPRLSVAGKEPVSSVGAVAPPALHSFRGLLATFPRTWRTSGRRAPGAAM